MTDVADGKASCVADAWEAVVLITDSHSFSGTQLLRFRYVETKTKALDASLSIYTVKMESQTYSYRHTEP